MNLFASSVTAWSRLYLYGKISVYKGFSIFIIQLCNFHAHSFASVKVELATLFLAPSN